MLRRFFRRIVVISGALTMTLAVFLVLPLIQAISKPPRAVVSLQTLDTTSLPPPPPPPQQEEEPEPEEEEEQAKPELIEDAPPLDLAQLELALNPGFSDGWLGGDFAVKLTNVATSDEEVDALFSLSDLDQKPRLIHPVDPVPSAAARKKAPGTVRIVFVVDESGKVVDPRIQDSTDPVFERPALAAVRQWRFEPGKKNGKPVKFRMRVPITFPEEP